MTADSSFPTLKSKRYAFFFDVDGTLAEIKPRPADVVIPATVLADLRALAIHAQGAVALISGRPLAQLDNLFAPLYLPAAGVHGAQRRDAQGHFYHLTLPIKVVCEVEQLLMQWLATLPGVQLEKKGVAFALHYRQAMHFEQPVMQLAQSLVMRFPMLALQPGKCVVEIKPKQTDKGSAITAFMREAPFVGCVPIFFGDDVTDEFGFLAVNVMHGITVKVGEGRTHARYRLSSVDEVYACITRMLLQLKQDETTSLQESKL